MVTLFDEKDLVSFGMYMISDQRKESITNNPEIDDENLKQALLKTVTQYDFNNWIRLNAAYEQEQEDALNEDVSEDTQQSIPFEENNPKVVQLNPRHA